MMTMQAPVRGKYGFYACDYATFLDLKAYHGLLLRAFRQFRAYQRWAARKGDNRYRQGRDPSGRRIGERIPVERPSYPEFMAAPEKGWSYAWGGEGDNAFASVREWPEFRRSGRASLYHHVLAVYQRARRPAATAEDVAPLDLPDDWRDQLAALRAHYAA